MAKNKQAGKVLNFVVWLTGVLVSLSVGFAMIDGTLTLPFWLGGNLGVPMIVGWVGGCNNDIGECVIGGYRKINFYIQLKKGGN